MASIAEERETSTRNMQRVRWFNCGERGHFSRDCPFDDIVCFECGELGHIGRNCEIRKRKVREEEPELLDGLWIRDYASQFGWEARRARGAVEGYNALNKTLFLEHEDGGKMDIYTTTMLVNACRGGCTLKTFLTP